jgi:ABC-type glycerol-3-phosphate transport system substrate-binding protein
MRKVTRRDFLRLSVTAAGGAIVAACAPAAPEVVEVIKEVPVEKEVIKEVVKEVPVEKVVEKEVVKEVAVEVEKVVTATPVPLGPEVYPTNTPIVQFTPIPRPAGAVNIELNVHWEGVRFNDFRSLVDEWNTGPGVDAGIYVDVGRIREAGGAQSGWLANYMADFQAGTAQDIYHHSCAGFAEMADLGLIAPAPPEVEHYVRENYLEACTALATWEGKVYGYPTEVQSEAFMANGLALESIGHSTDPKSLPTSWEEFRELSKALAEAGGGKKAGWCWTGAYHEGWCNKRIYMHPAEGDEPFIDVDKQKCNLDSEAGKRIMEHYRKMAIDDKSTTMGMIEIWNAYQEQVGALLIEDAWMLKYYVLLEGGEELFANTILALPPTSTGDNHKSEIRTYNYLVSSQSENPGAAWEFLQWMNELPEARMANWMCQVMGFLPNHQTGVAYPDFFTDNMAETFRAGTAAGAAHPYPNVKGVTQIHQVVSDMTNAVGFGDMEVDEACEQGAREIERAVFQT